MQYAVCNVQRAVCNVQYRDLASWGLNLVRLGVMWSGVEPVEGEYSTDYLHNIRTIVQNLGKHGVSVVLDLHQDVASSKFQSYDGFPTWLVAKLRRPASPHSFPWPLDKVESWFLGYVTLDVCQFYQVRHLVVVILMVVILKVVIAIVVNPW